MKTNGGFNYTIGNKKLGKDTLIFNMGPASNCPSKALGLCQVPAGLCYALKAERLYPQCLPFRKAQARYWKRSCPEKIARDIREALKKHKAIKYIRVNESGDFYSQKDVEKLFFIAAWVPDVTFYIYTARRDLDFRQPRPGNLVINGSGFMVDNNFCYEAKNVRLTCPGDCRICNLCKRPSGNIIRIEKH